MTDAIFASMRAQMVPSEHAQAALQARLAQTPRKEKKPMLKYIAAAACAALVLTAYPAYETLRPQPPLHNYVTVEGSAAITTQKEGTEDLGGKTGGGPDALTGVIDVPATPQEMEWAMTAYETLMARFEADYGPGQYPDWYGGAYLDDHVGLVVNVLHQTEDDKPLLLSIQDMAGSDKIAFGEAKYSLNALNTLQEQVVEKMTEWKLLSGCRVDERNNRLDLTLTEKTDEALAYLARLDPTNDAIYVQIGERAATTDILPGGAYIDTAAPAVSHAIDPNAAPASTEPDIAAVEPQIENLPQELPQAKQPAIVENGN